MNLYASEPFSTGRPHTLQMPSWSISSMVSSSGRYHGRGAVPFCKAPKISCCASILPSSLFFCAIKSFSWVRFSLLSADTFCLNSPKTGSKAQRIHSLSSKAVLKLVRSTCPLSLLASFSFSSSRPEISSYFCEDSLACSKFSSLLTYRFRDSFLLLISLRLLLRSSVTLSSRFSSCFASLATFLSLVHSLRYCLLDFCSKIAVISATRSNSLTLEKVSTNCFNAVASLNTFSVLSPLNRLKRRMKAS